MKIYSASDFFALTNRSITDEGYLVAPGAMARTGVQEYRAFELGLDAEGMDPMRVIRLHRPAEEVFNDASMKSFENKPITIEHPKEAVTAANWTELAKGEVRDVARAGDIMAGTLIIKAKEAIDAIQAGKVQLSNGYTFELDMTPGTTADGRAYDGVQRNIRGNHIALVDAARCGSACRIADSQPNQGVTTMADAKRKVVVDGIPLEVDDTAAAAIDKLVKQRDEAVAAKDTAVAELNTKHAEAIKAKDAEIETLKKDVMTPDARDAMLADWAKLIGDAKKLVPDLNTDGKTCLQIRREAIDSLMAKDATAKAVGDAILAGRKVETIDMDTARAVFGALAATVKTDDAGSHNANDAAVADALLGNDKGDKNEPVLTGRDKFMANSAQAWQQK